MAYPHEIDHLDVIGSTKLVLPLLIADCERDPHGTESVKLGIANFMDDGSVNQMMWLGGD